MTENRLQIIKEMETLLNKTRAANGIRIRYGYAEREYIEFDGKVHIGNIVFHESERELDKRDDPREEVQVKWGNQSDIFATYQSIESDSGFAIIEDIMKAVRKII